MSELIHLGRVRKKILYVYRCLSDLNESVDVFSESVCQESLNELGKVLEIFNVSVESLRATITSMIQEAAQEENSEIDVESDERGNKL